MGGSFGKTLNLVSFGTLDAGKSVAEAAKKAVSINASMPKAGQIASPAVATPETADTGAVAKRRKGNTRTMFTSPLGIGGMADTARKTLLGQ